MTSIYIFEKANTTVTTQKLLKNSQSDQIGSGNSADGANPAAATQKLLKCEESE